MCCCLFGIILLKFVHFLHDVTFTRPTFTHEPAAALSMMCLAIALKNELDSSSPGNPFGLPAGVQPEVRMAQYLGERIFVICVSFMR